VGGRENQEDAYCISDWRNPAVVAQRGVLAVVADGVGGMNNGQVASGTAVRSMISWFERQDPSKPMDIRLLELAATAQRDVLTAQQHAGRCGSTLVSVLIHNGYMTMLSIGDSRIALYRNGVLLPLNREHVNGKDIAETLSFGIAGGPVKGNPNAITSYLGKPDLRQIDRTITPMQLVSGDRILLMSDGVFGTLSDDEIISMLNMSPAQSAQAIVEAVAAKGKPHQDNATALVVAIN
jgi:serine/threonine protein phosphatase PrpC